MAQSHRGERGKTRQCRRGFPTGAFLICLRRNKGLTEIHLRDQLAHSIWNLKEEQRQRRSAGGAAPSCQGCRECEMSGGDPKPFISH